MLSCRQLAVVGVCVLLGCVLVGAAVVSSRDRYLVAGLVFEPITYDSSEAMASQLGGPLTSRELATIQQVARDEVTRAFAPFRVAISGAVQAMYHVRVVQEVRSAGQNIQSRRARRVAFQASAVTASSTFGCSSATPSRSRLRAPHAMRS